MLPTFVIGLREGLEAALIVGIIAAFLRKQGRRDLVKGVLAGVAAAIALCVIAGVALDAYSQNLPQKQQEGLETIIGALAVGMVTYMVVWMRRNSRHLKGQLEGMAADAIAAGSAKSKALRAMIAMAFLAVIREGLETVVFLLAAFNESGSGATAGVGAVLGVVVAAGLGYGIYRGGVRLNLSKFFRATGLVLVLVAAGLVVNALHTAHEAGWLDFGQQGTVDLSWLVKPGTVQASLLTGMLGIQSHPVVVELVGWAAYLVPVGLYVAWPPGHPVPTRILSRIAVGTAVIAALGALTVSVLAPAKPASRPVTSDGAVSARLVGDRALRTAEQDPVTRRVGPVRTFDLTPAGSAERAGRRVEVYRAQVPLRITGRPGTLAASAVARLNGGRLPIGVGTAAVHSVAYSAARTLTAWVDPTSGRVVDLAWVERVSAVVKGTVLPKAVAAARSAFSPTVVASAARAARVDADRRDRRDLMLALAATCAGLAAVALLTGAVLTLAARRRARVTPIASSPADRRLVQA